MRKQAFKLTDLVEANYKPLFCFVLLLTLSLSVTLSFMILYRSRGLYASGLQ